MNQINKLYLSLDEIIKLNQTTKSSLHHPYNVKQSFSSQNIVPSEDVQEDIKPCMQSLLNMGTRPQQRPMPVSLLSIHTNPTPMGQQMARKIFNEVPSSVQNRGLIKRTVNGRPQCVFTSHAIRSRTVPQTDIVLHKVNRGSSGRLGSRGNWQPTHRVVQASSQSNMQSAGCDNTGVKLNRIHLLHAVNRRQNSIMKQQQRLMAEQQLLQEQKQQLLNMEKRQITLQPGSGSLPHRQPDAGTSLTVSLVKGLNQGVNVYIPASAKKFFNRKVQLKQRGAWSNPTMGNVKVPNAANSSISMIQNLHLPRPPPAEACSIVDMLLGRERECFFGTPASTSVSLSERFMRKVNLSGN